METKTGKHNGYTYTVEPKRHRGELMSYWWAFAVKVEGVDFGEYRTRDEAYAVIERVLCR